MVLQYNSYTKCCDKSLDCVYVLAMSDSIVVVHLHLLVIHDMALGASFMQRSPTSGGNRTLIYCKVCLQEDTKPKAAMPVDDDEDIFGDAGTNYTPELPKSKAANRAASVPPAGSYFDEKDEMADMPAPAKAGQPDSRQAH